MSEYNARISWQRGSAIFLDNEYSRGHLWEFDGGVSVPATSSPHVVPVPMSVESNVDPEEAFVATLSSCHMLFFLSLAAKAGLLVNSYIDEAVGVLGKDGEGRMAMIRVLLRPRIEFGDDTHPDKAQIEGLHHRAHKLCFIANSVKSEVVIEPG